MSLTARRVAEIARQRMGAVAGDSKFYAMVTATIPQALKETGRKIAADPSTRDLLKTDKTSVKLTLTTGGKGNLVTVYASNYLLKEFIEFGEIYFLAAKDFATSAVDITGNTITITTERFKKRDRVRFTTTGTIPSGLALLTDYYVVADSTAAGLFQVASDPGLLSVIDFASQGVGTHTITVQESADFKLQKVADAGLVPFDRYLESMFRYYYIQGDTIYVLPISSTGQVAFAVPYFPNNLAALPDSAEGENIFIETLLDLLRNKDT